MTLFMYLVCMYAFQLFLQNIFAKQIFFLLVKSDSGKKICTIIKFIHLERYTYMTEINLRLAGLLNLCGFTTFFVRLQIICFTM